MTDMSTEIKDYIMKNRNIFEDVQNSRKENSGSSRVGEHSILNYPKIMDDIIKYMQGFKKYKDSGDSSYKHKVIQSTYTFYNKMFDADSNSKYRKNITLSEFPNMNYKFIEKSKELHQLLKELKGSIDNETVNMITVTERQYRKIAKVNKDDMRLYLWLSSNATISTDIRTYYNDPKTPVMHKKR